MVFIEWLFWFAGKRNGLPDPGPRVNAVVEAIGGGHEVSNDHLI
jgi:hypothetical protein